MAYPMPIQLPHCGRCGHSLLRAGEECSNCAHLEQLTAGWPKQRREEFWARELETNQRARQQVEIEINSKGTEAFLAEEEVRAQLQPDIPVPAAAQSGRDFTQMTEAEKEEIRQWSAQRRFALPVGVAPMMQTRIVHRCTELTSEDGQPLPGVALAFDHQAWWWGADDHLDPRWLNAFPWTTLQRIEIGGPETVESQVTLPRALMLGLFSLAMKRKDPVAYLTLQTNIGTRIFRVDDLQPIDLQAHLAPVTDWLDQHREQLQALASA